jgi:hypothetical protein
MKFNLPESGEPSLAPELSSAESMFAKMLADLPDADEPPGKRPAAPHSLARAPQRAAGSRRQPPAATRILSRSEEPVAALDPQSVSQQIMEQLEKYNIAASSRLRIEVHDGVVVVAGEVPSAYERQLVGHFCRQIPGVVKFVDGMVLRSEPAATVQKRPKPRPARPSIEWRLPFQIRHIAIAVSLVLALWAGYSFATRDGSKRLVYAVTGTVMFEGHPAEGATVVLHPVDRSITIRPRGVVDADGSFELTTYLPGDGAPVGEYKVTIDWRKPVDVGGDFLPGPNLLPEALASVGTTKLHASVPRGGGELEPYEITK